MTREAGHLKSGQKKGKHGESLLSFVLPIQVKLTDQIHTLTYLRIIQVFFFYRRVKKLICLHIRIIIQQSKQEEIQDIGLTVQILW